MKTIKKIMGALLILLLGGLVVQQLITNKKQMNAELAAVLEYQHRVPIEVVMPIFEQSADTLSETGSFRATKEVTVMSETQGQVLSVHGEIGDYISAGTVLATVEKDVLESQLQLAKANLDQAEKDLQRFEQLVEGDAVTAQQVEQMQLNHRSALTNYQVLQKQLQNTTIKAPISGILLDRMVEKGAFLAPTMAVASLTEPAALDFVVRVQETDVIRLRRGQRAEVTVGVFPDQSFQGVVSEIGIGNDLSGRYEVVITVSNPGFRLRPGMNGEASFSFSTKNNRLILPRKCIVGSVQDAQVFVVRDSIAIPRNVSIEMLDAQKVVVTKGLTEEDRVVLSGQINLERGTVVNILNP